MQAMSVPIAGVFADRSRRVIALTALIALLSLADLFMTLTFLRTVGMSEANPVARMVMSYGSPTYLVVWKLASIAVASTVFWLARRRRLAEAGCWVCVAVLVWLTVRWIHYSQEVETATPLIHVLASGECPTWVTMAE